MAKDAKTILYTILTCVLVLLILACFIYTGSGIYKWHRNKWIQRGINSAVAQIIQSKAITPTINGKQYLITSQEVKPEPKIVEPKEAKQE